MEITVHKIEETVFQVTVTARATTTHTVTLSSEYYHDLTRGTQTPERLIERSFEFLLEREPNTSILRRFDLPLIQNYFPEYEETIRRGSG